MGLAITAIVVGILIYFVFVRKEISGGSGENALDILKKRYARGEISKEVYEQMKKDLES